MKRHPLDLLSLLSGLVFLGVAIVYLVADATERTPSAGVVMPLMIMGLGIAGLVAAVQSQRRTDDAAVVAAESESGFADPIEVDER